MAVELYNTLHRTRATAAAMSAISGEDTNSYVWPSLAEINTRARRLVNAFLKQQRREELRQVQLMKVCDIHIDR